MPAVLKTVECEDCLFGTEIPAGDGIRFLYILFFKESDSVLMTAGPLPKRRNKNEEEEENTLSKLSKEQLDVQIKKEIKYTCLLTAVCAAWHIITGFALNGNGAQIMHMPQWFVVSVFGQGIIAIIGIILLTKKVFIDFDYDDEVED